MDVKAGKIVSSIVDKVTCGELSTRYVSRLQAQKKPAAYIIEKCIDANIRRSFEAMKVAKLQTSDFERCRAKRVQAAARI